MKINKTKQFTEFFDEFEGWRQIDFMVLHHVQADSVDHAIAQFKEHKVSSHFLIAEDGEIFELVGENDISYHAGVSFWNGVNGLNLFSIGIEFINSAPFDKKFTQDQMNSGVVLCKYLAAKYAIKAQNIVGHSDIAYNRETGLLDRKQDPSHLFDWKFLSDNGVGFFPQIIPTNESLFKFGDRDSEILHTKVDLKKFGYRVVNLNEEFDEEMRALVRVFNRRFLNSQCDFWCADSQRILDKLIAFIR